MEARFNAGPSVLDVKSVQYRNAVRRKQTLEYVEKSSSRALPPSDKQKSYLSFLLGDHLGWYGLLVWVRFANGYRAECEPLTRIHWIEAINLAKTGRNSHGSVESLVDMSFDP